MAQIARAAGISKALLSHYFPSKRGLFRGRPGRGRRAAGGAELLSP